MNQVSRPVVNDAEIRAGLDWLYSVARDVSDLRRRVAAAQDHYRVHTIPSSGCWWRLAPPVVATDIIASYIAQAESLLTDWRTYDLSLGSRVIPFIKHLGVALRHLNSIPSARNRARRLLEPQGEHPDGAIFELAVAVKYAMDGFSVEFIPEGAERTGDLRLLGTGLGRDVQVECKRLRPSLYDLRELAIVRDQFDRMLTAITGQERNIVVDVTFHTDLDKVPQFYLADRVAAILASPLQIPGRYPWTDAVSSGSVREADTAAVEKDTLQSSLLFGSKLARLLSGNIQSEDAYLMAVNGIPREGDPRYLDTLDRAWMLTWRCDSKDSIEARARHIRSKLADVDRQLARADFGIVHFGMNAERDAAAADLRRQRNLDVVRSFTSKHSLREINLHYFLPRVTEISAWMIDETVDWNASISRPLLADPRLLAGERNEIDTDVPAWRLPAPGTS